VMSESPHSAMSAGMLGKAAGSESFGTGSGGGLASVTPGSLAECQCVEAPKWPRNDAFVTSAHHSVGVNAPVSGPLGEHFFEPVDRFVKLCH
jgi:hypothetical protein